ncbi:MAG: hypothetical protein V3V08_03915 [Nannocystaceae bacterium]
MTIATESFAASVGADVSSKCSKCGEVLHVVLTHKDELVDKCECKECGRRHKFKPVDPEVIAELKAYKKAKKAAANPPKKKAAKKRVSRAKAPAIPEVVIDDSRPLLAYSTRGDFAVEDQIEHPSFGRGVVVGIVPPQKMQVHFIDVGPKTLLFGRT